MESSKVKQELFDVNNENLQKLASLFPSAVKDGQLDIDALKEELGQFEEVGQEKYELTWAGKQNAKKEARRNVLGKTLRYIEGDGVDEDTTQNLYIEGDNLEVLKLLRKNYYGKIKMIYIDPPYNTGNDFVYNDNFSMTQEELEKMQGERDEYGEKLQKNSKDSAKYHTNWLNMMYPRLQLAKDLLTEDGVIFISIDDNEISNLLKITTEILGFDSLVGLFSVENNPKGRKNSNFISVSNDYCAVFAKNKGSCYFIENIPKNINDLEIDENGNYVHNSGKRVLVGSNDFNNVVTNFNSDKHYSVYYNAENNDLILKTENDINEKDSGLISKGYTRYISTNSNNQFVENTYTKIKFQELFNELALDFKENKIFGKNFNTTIRIKSMLVNNHYKAVIDNSEVDFKLDFKTTSAGAYLKELFNTVKPVFQATKNIGLLKLLITLFDDESFTVLDFFSGSGTTADACMRVNNEWKCKNIKYIMVQLPETLYENNSEDKIAVDFLRSINKQCNICEIGKERIRRAGNKIKEEIEAENQQLKLGEEPKNVPDIGFKVFRVGETTLNWEKLNLQGKDIYHDYIAGTSEKDKLDFTPDFKNDLNVVYEIMLRQEGLPLTSKIEKLTDIGSRTYLVADSYLISLEEDITPEMVEKLSTLNPLPIKFVFRDSAFDDNIVFKDETFRRLNALIDKNTSDEKKTYTVEFI